MGRLHNVRLPNGKTATVTIKDGSIAELSFEQSNLESFQNIEQAADLSLDGDWNGMGMLLAPSMVDMHVHSRDPGFPNKETWSTLAQGAFKGGVTAVADMPNTRPPTLFKEQVFEKVEAAEAAGIRAKVFLGVTEANVDSLKDIISETRAHLAGLKVYYGKSTGGLIFDDLKRLKAGLAGTDILLVFHSEDQCCIDATRANYGPEYDSPKFEDFLVHSRVRSKEAAITSSKILLAWAETVGCPFHLAHVSTPEEVVMVQEARAKGAQVTCEVAPHHLLLAEEDYPTLGPFIKVNPPVRSRQDVEAMRGYFKEGCFDAFATDHAPHTKAEKLQSLGLSPSGIPSIEFFTPLLWQIGSELGISDEALVAMGSTNPARLIGLRKSGELAPGFEANLVLLSDQEYNINSDSLVCKSKWTPYDGKALSKRVEGVWKLGRRVYLAERGKGE